MKTTQTWKIGDCLELLPDITDKSIDMILTDLPYGITSCSWDSPINLDCLWAEYRRIIKDNSAIVLTGIQPFTSTLISSAVDIFKYELIWDKVTSGNPLIAKVQPLKTHENILIFGNGKICYNPQMIKGKMQSKGGGYYKQSGTKMNTTVNDIYYPKSIITINKPNRTLAVHYTEKPINLFEYLIRTYTNEGDTVHDSCLGSGTTLEACANLNRNCIGFEISHEWEEHYRKRLKLDNTKLDAWADRVLVGCE